MNCYVKSILFLLLLLPTAWTQPVKRSGPWCTDKNGNTSLCSASGTLGVGTPLPTTAALVAPNILTSLPAGIPGSLSRFFDTSNKAMASKVIAVFGNSIVAAANELFTQLATYAAGGQVLAGLTVTPTVIDGGTGWVTSIGNILNQGHNGQLLATMLGDSTIPNLCATNPDLIVIIAPLMNDVRQGALTLDQGRSLIGQMLSKITACAPGADLLMLTEPTILTTDVGALGFVVPNTPVAAQAYSTLIHDAVVPFTGAYPQLVVLDTQTALFGLQVQATSAYMLNQIHPGPAGRVAEADLIAGVMGQLKYKPAPPPKFFPAYRAGTIATANLVGFTPATPMVVSRIEFLTDNAEFGCTTYPAVRILDVTASSTVVANSTVALVSAGSFKDSGLLSVVLPANHQYYVQSIVGTGGCSPTPSGVYVSIQYR
jgi:hypothetical protein